MAWDVDVWTDDGGPQTVRINTTFQNSAKRQAVRMTGGRYCGMRQVNNPQNEPSWGGVKRAKSKDSSMSMPNVGGSGALLGVLALLVLAVWILPWIMAIGGAVGGAWITGKLFGTNLGRAMEEDKVKLVGLIVIVSTLLGATGYVKGYEWREQFVSEPVPEQLAEPAIGE